MYGTIRCALWRCFILSMAKPKRENGHCCLAKNSIGSQSMRSRDEILGASLLIDSKPNKGTVVSHSMPIIMIIA